METPKSGREKQPPLNECVRVVVRCRPLSDQEKNDNHKVIINVVPDRGIVQICNPKENSYETKKVFTYDAVYDWDSTIKTIYDEMVRPLVASVLTGFNGCVFAYGQTGTGKTYTMEGLNNIPEQLGIIPKTFEQIWNHIDRTTNTSFLVTASYLEIYMEELKDLLKRNSTKALEIRERQGWGIYVPGLHSVVCKNVDDMLKVMRKGNKNRTIGHTNMNTHSSRSHAAFMITIEMCDTDKNTVTVGKLNLIDLAGSERQSKTGATAERLKEASKINQSLSSLGNVISALAETSPHIPYRDSKLTRLLQDSLGGNSKTIMIANIGPASYNYDETLTTLRYAHRAKTIQNLPILNEDPKDAKLREYQTEIARLKALIVERQLKEAKGENKKHNMDRKKVRHTVSSKLVNLNSFEDDNDNSCSTDTNDEEYDTDTVPEFADKEAVLAANRSEQICKKQLVEMERLKTEELARILHNLESQLVRGGKNIFESVNENQIQIEDRLAEIAERKKREVEMQQRLMHEEETNLGIRETFSSLQQEVEAKSRKLKKFYLKLQATKQDFHDLKEEHNRDRRELEITQNALVKEMKLKLMIIDNFVPAEEKCKLYAAARYDEELDDWVLTPLYKDSSASRRPISKPGRRRPVSEMAFIKAAIRGPRGLRYRSENIISHVLDMPMRTTFEYTAPAVSPRLQSVLDDALQPEADLEITGFNNGYSSGQQSRNSATARARARLDEIKKFDAPSSARPKTSKSAVLSKTALSPVYPKARGLVPK